MAIETYEVYTTSNGFKIPYQVITERRRGGRASLVQKGLNIRIPAHAGKKWKQEKIKEFLHWVNQLANSNPASLIRFYPFEYLSDDIITIYNKVYTIIPSSQLDGRLQIQKNEDTFSVPEAAMDASYSASILRAISNILKSHFHPVFIKKVEEINNRTLGVKYSSIHLNHTSSKWGSCDSKGRIWLSNRLLCMPDEVQEYIIIHELAHRIEANHSIRFWDLVSRYNPNFKNHKKWLKVNGALCDFYPDRVKQEILSLSNGYLY